MLTYQQKAQLETIEQWLIAITQSSEFQQLEYYPDLTLADALLAVREMLQAIEQPQLNSEL